MSAQLVVSWILGSIFMLGGVWIITNLEMNLGVTESSYIVALIIAFIMFLLAGFLWISVAVGTEKQPHHHH